MRPMSHLTGTQIAETIKVAAGQAIRPGSSEAETRNREEYYADLRVADAKEKSVTAATDRGRGAGRSGEVG